MTGRDALLLGAILNFTWAGWPVAADAETRHRAAAHAQTQGRQVHGRQTHGRQTHERRRAAEPRRDRSLAAAHPGRVQKGKASIYAPALRGRRMADGTPFNPASNAAASKTLPLGTTARVTNLDNGRTATVQVRDRGPYRAGRIIDVSPGSAGALGMGREGVAPVAVAPLTPPSGGQAR